jgi:hypothetical protein
VRKCVFGRQLAVCLLSHNVGSFAYKYVGVHAWEMPISKFQENYFVRLLGPLPSCQELIFRLVCGVYTQHRLRPTDCPYQISPPDVLCPAAEPGEMVSVGYVCHNVHQRWCKYWRLLFVHFCLSSGRNGLGHDNHRR